MPSIKDVAKHCGVSYATVSNVINNKGNVGEETRKKVEEAIEKLHYIPHTGARTLKRKVRNVIGVVLPSIHDPYLSRLYMGIQETLFINNNFMINLIITNDISTVENQGISELLMHHVDGIILMSCQPGNPEAFKLIEQKKIPTVLVDRNIDITIANFVSFDYKNIGRHLCGHIIEKGYRRPALITGPSSYTSEHHFIEGFFEEWAERNRRSEDVTVMKSVYNRFSAFKSMIKILNYHFGTLLPDVVITSNKILYDGAREALFMQADEKKRDIDILTLEEVNWLEASYTDTGITLYRPAKRLGILAAELLIENITFQKIHTPKTKMLNFHDFASELKREPSERMHDIQTGRTKSGKLVLYMLRDMSTWAISSLIPNFKLTVKSDVEFDIREFEYEELYDRIVASRDDRTEEKPDIVMIDNFWFPYLVKNGYLIELSEYSGGEEDARSGFITQVFEYYSMYNGKQFAVPFNFIVQLLFYRKDLFNNEGSKREFLNRYGVELKVPETWDEYNAVAEFFTKSFNPGSPIDYGNTATAATTTICDFLPRLWAYGGSVFDRKGNLTIDSYEAVEALKSYIRSFQYAPSNAIDDWYWNEVEEFAKGNAAMMINFIAHTAQLFDLEYSKVAGNFGVSQIPGGFPVLSGWSLGIHSGSLNQELAYLFIQWASSSKIAIPYSILGGCTPRSSLSQTEELTNLYPYFGFAEEQFQKSRKRTYPFDQLVNLNMAERDFEVIVHRNIRKAILGEMNPENALQQAVQHISAFSVTV